MKQNMTRLMICPALLVMLLAGCMKRELETRPAETVGYAEIALDWEGDTRPETACYLFYDESGKLVKEVNGLTSGFKGALSAGKYRLVVHNEDARQVDYRGMESYATAEAFAMPDENESDLKSTKSKVYIQQPQFIFGTGKCKEFELLVVEPDKTTRATVTPKLLTHQVQFLFAVKGSNGVRSLEGILDGIAPGVFLSTGKCNDVLSCASKFTTVPRNEASAVEFVANVMVFNLLTTAESPAETNTIGVTLTETDGTQHAASFDLTSTLQKIISDNGGVIPIEIPIEIDLEIKPIEGLTATVRPWDDSGSGSGDPRPQR